jgi:uncharacterized iron-regulated protein
MILIPSLDLNIRRIAALTLGLIAIVMLDTSAVAAAPQIEIEFTPHQQQILRQIHTANVVYLGETHDRISDHQQQLAIIQTVFKNHHRGVTKGLSSTTAIAMEMFQRPAQLTLDRYLVGEITDTQLREQTEFDRRWGFRWEDYLPILKFARANRLPLIALNTPTEITRKVAKQGLESLTAADLQYIPAIADIDYSNTQYQEMILASYRQHVNTAMISSKSFNRFYTAQLLWDETMAERIADYVNRHPSHQIIVLAGSTHIIYGDGIPNRVRRRLKQSNFTQKTILLSHDGDLQKDAPQPVDFIWNKD